MLVLKQAEKYAFFVLSNKENVMSLNFPRIVAGFLLIIFHGWVFSSLWGWYVVSFFNLPPLSVAHAVGLIILISVVTLKINPEEVHEKQKSEKKAWREFFFTIFMGIYMSAVFLFMGWVFHFFL